MSKPDILTFPSDEDTRKASQCLMEKFPHLCEERFLPTHVKPKLCLIWDEKKFPLMKHEKPQVIELLRQNNLINI